MDAIRHYERLQTLSLLALCALAAAVALYWLRPVFLPFTLALLFTFILTALINAQMRYLGFPRGLAVAGALLTALLIFAGLGTAFATSVDTLISNAEIYNAYYEKLFDKVVAALGLNEPSADTEQILDNLNERSLAYISSLIAGTTGVIVTVISNAVMVILFVMFLLIGQQVRKRAQDDVAAQVERRVSRYIATITLMAAIIGISVGAIMSLLGIQSPWVFGFLAFVSHFVPTVGPIVATLAPIPVLVANPEVSVTTGVLAILIPGVIQFAVGNVIEPKVLGHSLDLHPVTILLALIFWGMIWGVVGMVLATPITAVIKIYLERFNLTVPVANLLAGR